MNEKNLETQQKLVVTNRNQLYLDAVEDVRDFSDSLLVLSTKYGDVFVEGEGMKILNLSEKEGTVSIVGKIDGFYFKAPKKNGFFGGIFK